MVRIVGRSESLQRWGNAQISAFEAMHPLSSDHEYLLLPGFCDVHVHFREPGFSYKETILSGTRSAARGGYTAVCTMPNLDPVPDCLEALNAQLGIIARDAVIAVYPYAALTVGEKGETPAALSDLAPYAIAFSDDGKGVQDDGMMRELMQEARRLNKLIAAHCEVNSLLEGGYIHKGAYAAAHGHKGICSESEWRMIERDLDLAAQTGCAYHVCHISCKESAALIRAAKKSGVNVTCETGPHYLTLDDSVLEEDGRFKMNPPLRDRSDREALVEALTDGTIDMIATDHAPHSAAEKARGLSGSAFGVVGLETAFPVMYTGLVEKGVITLDKLVELMALAPRRRFGIPLGEDLTLWDLSAQYPIDPAAFLSMGRATPFAGLSVRGKCLMTVYHGNIVYSADEE